MTVRLVSTTETQEELDHAASENWRAPLEPKAADPDPATQEVETQEAAPGAAEEQEQEQPKIKGGYRKKIEKLTQLAKRLEDDLEAERKARRDVEARLAPRAGSEQPTDSDAEPQLEKFATIQEYIRAMTKWHATQTLKTHQQEAEKVEEAEEAKTVFDAYNENVAKARAEHDDFDEVVGRKDIQIPQGVQLAIFEMDNGPEVAYYLGQHPEVCGELVEMRPMAAVAAIGRIAASLEKPSPEVKQRTEPPPPIRPVGGASARSSVPLDQLKLSEFVKVRNQQERARR